MQKLIFITGSGRCGTHLILSLLDGNKKLNVVPGEITNIFIDNLFRNGQSNRVYKFNKNIIFENFKAALKDHNFPFVNKKLSKIKKLINFKFRKNYFININDYLSIIINVLFNNKKTTVINIQDENLVGLLELFPNCKIIHMLRNPLSQINSRYMYRYKNPSNHDGLEFCNSFFRNYNSFKNAFITRESKRVKIIKMENLISNTKKEMKNIFKFLNYPIEKINYQTTQYGKKFDTYNYYPNYKNLYTNKKSTGIKKVNFDYSCLTPNDLYLISKLKYVKYFYKINKFKKSGYNFFYFFFRHLGLIGNNRTFNYNPIKLVKLSLFSFYLFFLDMNTKKNFFRSDNI